MTTTKPYSFWFHPHVSFLDKILQIVVCLFIPTYRLALLQDEDDDNKNKNKSRKDHKQQHEQRDKLLHSIRRNIRKQNMESKDASIAKWAKALSGRKNNNNNNATSKDGGGGQCEIIEHVVSIPRNTKILEEWGIVTPQEAAKVASNHKTTNDHNDHNDDDDDDDDSSNRTTTTTELLFRFPSTLLPDFGTNNAQTTKNGTIRISDEFNVAQFLAKHCSTIGDVPIVLFFHGGGFTVGTHYDLLCPKWAAAPSVQTGKPVILVSIQYGLAPDHVFPTLVQDCLTAVSYLQTAVASSSSSSSSSLLPLHVLGVSAGGHLATVVALECHRRFPGMVKSAVVLCPMLDPAADSISYYLNSQSSWLADVRWLRWSWRVLLGMDPKKTKDAKSSKTNAPNQTLDDRLKEDSNFQLWMDSKWKGTGYERLIHPTVGVASLEEEQGRGGDSNDTAATLFPSMLICTQEADPLRDEGIALVGALRVHTHAHKITHLHTKGSHAVGLMVDSKAMAQLTAWMVDVMFPVTSSNKPPPPSSTTKVE